MRRIDRVIVVVGQDDFGDYLYQACDGIYQTARKQAKRVC